MQRSTSVEDEQQRGLPYPGLLNEKQFTRQNDADIRGFTASSALQSLALQLGVKT